MIDKTIREIGELVPFNAELTRIVETQQYAATTNLVDDLEEQSLLEEMINGVKPNYRKGTESLHYLISTPFRYPPLNYGSRFGDITMPSYFYASENILTALSECAFYRLVFLHDMKTPYEKPIKSEHMSFCVEVASPRTANLINAKTEYIKEKLASPTDYRFTQSLGKHLTEKCDATAIRFYSARAKEGINVAVVNPEVILSEKPKDSVNWICHTTMNKISFNCHGEKPVSFSLDSFLVDGELPVIA